jgi:hypothetical protein
MLNNAVHEPLLKKPTNPMNFAVKLLTSLSPLVAEVSARSPAVWNVWILDIIIMGALLGIVFVIEPRDPNGA